MLSVFHENLDYSASDRGDLVKELHRFNDADRLAGVDDVSTLAKAVSPNRGRNTQRADNGRFMVREYCCAGAGVAAAVEFALP